jgi:hypothetical protein
MTEFPRRWSLSPADPYCAVIAADARHSQTDYRHDVAWELQLGAQESTALALTTRYGGRVGLASIAPSWLLEGRSIFQAVAYAHPPILTGFAPGYLRAEAALTPSLDLLAEYLVFDSHSVGGRFTVTNKAANDLSLRLDLVGFIALNGRELKIVILPDTNRDALAMKAGNLRPVTLLEGGRFDGESSAKIGVNLSVPANGQVSVKWTSAARASSGDSMALAVKLLEQDFDALIITTLKSAAAIPVIQTGDDDTDAAIASSYQQLVQSFLKPTSYLPFSSFVATRQPGRGADTSRSWIGQNPTDAYLTALGVAAVDPALAQGIVLNYLAIQKSDGWIDFQPGLGGQRQGVLCLPILARLAWGIFQYTEDDAFLAETYPKLVKFFERWLQSDLDVDGDSVPEWQSEAQTGYPYMPTFAAGRSWGQGADIRLVEAPDLLAYLLSEAVSLREIAYYLHYDAGEAAFAKHIDRLNTALETLWQKDRYVYRDRDTHLTTSAESILKDGRGGEEHFVALLLAKPSRLIVHVIGGWEHVPQLTLKITGKDRNNQAVEEIASADKLMWSHGRGVYTTQSVFSAVDKIQAEHLVSVYRVEAATMDTSGVDMSTLLPLWSVGIDHRRAQSLILLVMSDFLRPNGATMLSHRDLRFDPSNADGAGGVWLFWNTLIGEGLIELERFGEAADLLKNILKAQVKVLKAEKNFFQFYHTDEAKGLGERGHTAGIVPLHLLWRVLGVRIISPRKVWAGGPFLWGKPIIIRQHGVEVRRAENGTVVRFPSGHIAELAADAPFNALVDSGTMP